MTGLTPRALSPVPDEPDQVPRLTQFRRDHPDVAIRAGQGYWQALVPERNGETVITRYRLKDLLDKLQAVTGQPGR